MNASEIKSFRKRLGMTQEQFAVHLGVTSLSVRRWEKGTRQPSPMARRLLEILKEEVKKQ